MRHSVSSCPRAEGRADPNRPAPLFAGRPFSHAARSLPGRCLASMAWLVVAASFGCAEPGVTQRVQADHALGRAGTASLHTGRTLAEQGPGAAGSQADADRRAAEQAARPVLRRASRPWIGSVSVPMGSGERLPSIFTEAIRLNFDDAATGGKVGLRTMADRITAVTGVPVRLKADVFAPGEPSARAPAAPVAVSSQALPALPGRVGGGTEAFASSSLSLPVVRDTSVNAVAMRWSGSLADYLDLVTDQLSLSWEYRDGVVVIERFRTEFFEIAALESETDYHLGLSGADQANATSAGNGGGGTNSTASSSNEVSEHGKSNVIGSILATVGQIIKDVPGSSVVRSDGSGRIAVTTTQETLSKVRDFLRAENESLLRQAQVQFDVYSVTRNESDERGIEWNAVLAALGGAYTGRFGAPATLASATAADIGFSILTPTQSGVTTPATRHFGGSTALLKLLSEYGISTQHREVSLLALNRTWDRKSSLGGRAYVSATLPGAASTTGVGAPGLVTSTVTTGDRYLAQPFILDNDTVVLKFGIGLSSLVNLVNFTSGTGSAQQTVQTPETSAINDQATVALKAGQILVITGLSRLVSSDDRRTLTDAAPIGLGGSKTQSRLREEFVIFVRPTIL
jgi:type IVB pilus formation R64 PilN family outer membrane protein